MEDFKPEALVTAKLGEQKYLTNITAGNKEIIGDEPVDLGGQDKGLNPYELLASALAMCTAATLRMYSERKGWDLGEIKVDVGVKNDTSTKTTFFEKHISFSNSTIAENELKRLKAIADACPVNKMLTNQIEIKTIL